ncbi:NUDIX hydrolase [Paenibacillus lentus]|uniref:NUDIX hydrolase n=1 Tax=Paenibacillus lentus TaxID=1338368 RepID=UPI003662D134
MLSKLVKIVPNKWLVFMYKRFPSMRLKNWMVYKAQHKFLVAVLGVITNESGQIMLLHHVYRDEPWGIPGGWMELEKPELGLKREIYEETGLKVRLSGVARAVFGVAPNRVELIFSGQVIEGEFKPSAEISNICFVNAGEWPEGLPESQRKLLEDILMNTKNI